MGVSSLPKTVTRQRRDCDLNPGPSAPESSMLTTYILGAWERCKLPQRGQGQSPSRNQIWCFLALK